MYKDFITYEQALELKELGFDERCFAYYVGLGDNKEKPFKLVQIQSEKGQFEWTDNVYHAPTYSQAFRWFREKYNLHNGIYPYYDEYEFQIKDFRLPTNTPINSGSIPYEEAELECLNKLIEMVKNK